MGTPVSVYYTGAIVLVLVCYTPNFLSLGISKSKYQDVTIFSDYDDLKQNPFCVKIFYGITLTITFTEEDIKSSIFWIN